MAALSYPDDATRENVCLRVATGWHRDGLLSHERDVRFGGTISALEKVGVDEPTVVDCEGRAGTVVFPLVVHSPERGILRISTAASSSPLTVRSEGGAWRLFIAEAEFNSLYEIQEGSHEVDAEAKPSPADARRPPAMSPPKGTTVPHVKTSDGVRIAYQVRGDGPPLVLLSGQANDHHWWDGVRDDFADSRSTVTIDYRGTGESDKPHLPYSTERFADDVVAILDELAVDRADVYGTSMGGRVAQSLAIRHSRRVRALVLGCTSAGGRHGIDRGAKVRRSLIRPNPVEARQALLELMYTPGWLAMHLGPYHTLGDRSMPAHARRGHLVASDGHDAWDALPGIVAPTLVLHGTDDLLNPTANAPLLAARIPGSRLELIQGARHAYFEECRDLASPLVLEFLDQKMPAGDPQH